MLKVVFNKDGSIRKYQLPTYVVKGSSGEIDALKLEVAVDGLDITTGYIVQAQFRLPNGERTQPVVLLGVLPYVELFETQYPNAKYGYMTQAQTLYEGVVKASIEIRDFENDNNILYTFPFDIIVNPSTYDPDDDDSQITHAEYYQLLNNIEDIADDMTLVKRNDITCVPYIDGLDLSQYPIGKVLYDIYTRALYRVEKINGNYVATNYAPVIEVSGTSGTLAQYKLDILLANKLGVIKHDYYFFNLTNDILGKLTYESYKIQQANNTITIVRDYIIVDKESGEWSLYNSSCSCYNKDKIDTELALKEDKSNKVIELSPSSTNDQYPSAKCVYDLMQEMMGKTFTPVDITTYPTLEDFLEDYENPEEGVIYLYPVDTSESPTFESGYYRYIWENNNWVSLGSTQMDLSNYYTKSETDNTFAKKEGALPEFEVQSSDVITTFLTNNSLLYKPFIFVISNIPYLAKFTWAAGYNFIFEIEKINNKERYCITTAISLQNKTFADILVDAYREDYALESELDDVVHLTGNETITGDKHFSHRISLGYFTNDYIAGGESSNDHALRFNIWGLSKFQILSNEIVSNVKIIPYKYDSTLDLGSSISKWQDLYLSRNLTDGTNAITIANIENKSNKVTSISGSSTDTQYPSAKCVWDLVQTVKRNAFIPVNTTTYPRLADFLASTGEEGYLYLYPVNTSDLTKGYKQYIWENSDWVYMGDTNLDLTSYYTKTESDNKYTNQSVIASAYSNLSTYAVGDLVIYNNTLYKCTTAITQAEDFDSTKWVEVKIADEFVDLTSAQTITGNKNHTGALQKNGVDVATTDQAFNVINASDIENNTLTPAQYDLITNGKPTLIKGSILTLYNPIIFPSDSTVGTELRCVIWCSQGMRIIRISNNLSIQLSSLYSLTLEHSTNSLSLKRVRELNGKLIPAYPSSTGTFVLKCVDGVLTWVAE